MCAEYRSFTSKNGEASQQHSRQCDNSQIILKQNVTLIQGTLIVPPELFVFFQRYGTRRQVAGKIEVEFVHCYTTGRCRTSSATFRFSNWPSFASPWNAPFSIMTLPRSTVNVGQTAAS